MWFMPQSPWEQMGEQILRLQTAQMLLWYADETKTLCIVVCWILLEIQSSLHDILQKHIDTHVVNYYLEKVSAHLINSAYITVCIYALNTKKNQKSNVNSFSPTVSMIRGSNRLLMKSTLVTSWGPMQTSSSIRLVRAPQLPYRATTYHWQSWLIYTLLTLLWNC